MLAEAAPYSHRGTRSVGAVLIHGFTGSPSEMRPIGEELCRRGLHVEAPLLRGHGTHPRDLLGCTATDWMEDVRLAVERLRGRVDRVALVGLSMGGALALHHAAADHRIASVVSMAAPLVLADWRLRFIRPLSRLIKWQAWGRPDIARVEAWNEHVGYRRYPPRALLSLLDVTAAARARLPSVSQPVLIAHGRQDTVVPIENVSVIRDALGSDACEVLWLDSSRHILTLDLDRGALIERVVGFVEETTGDMKGEVTGSDA
ncbi:MAG: alpha/beta fold hydrolase [Chloroflexota bacterium]